MSDRSFQPLDRHDQALPGLLSNAQTPELSGEARYYHGFASSNS
jgi:hypothetical protein